LTADNKSSEKKVHSRTIQYISDYLNLN